MNGQGLIKGLAITLKHFFQKEITEQYPDVMPELAPRFRGCLRFEFEKCIACGICVNSCPNDVLSFETEKRDKSKKKKLLSYTIDFQYCMFCNLCVEGCPTSCLSFDHDFELSQFKREDIKKIYLRPEGLDEAQDSPADQEEQKDKEQKQIAAMLKALQKSPQKVLSKLLEGEEDINILSELIQSDQKTAGKIAELIVKDKEKAVKVATGFINKDRKNRAQKGENGEGGDKDV